MKNILTGLANSVIVVGYTRVSTDEQNLDRGIIAINEYCKSKGLRLRNVYTDKQTGKNFERPGYVEMKKMVGPGDLVIIPELDRLGRNYQEMKNEVQYFRNMKVRLKFLDMPGIDWNPNDSTTMLLEDMMMALIMWVADQELKKIKKRQREGIDAKRSAAAGKITAGLVR